MKKILLSALLSTVLIIGVTAVSADQDIKNPETQINVSFEAGGDKPTKPVDPTDPEKPVDPNGPTDPEFPGTGMEGPLTIDHVPTLGFPNTKIEGKTQYISTTQLKPFVQVTDVRGGDEGGWQLQARLSNLSAGSENVLAGAKVVFNDSKVLATDSQATQDQYPLTDKKIEIIAGANARPVLTAEKNTDQGRGTWLNSWLAPAGSKDNEKVQLVVNTSKARNVSYSAKITWLLSEAP